MGIDKDVAKFLLSARERKANFQKTLMLGNQSFQVFDSDCKTLGHTFNLNNLGEIENAADFFRRLGAREVSSMDVSDYEGAAILHDLNQPISDDLKEKFTFVLDGGTLEHIFNFPTALSNAMKMVKVGGHLVIITGGNNFLGHGFYQFSPELFYRAFSEENGFAVKRMDCSGSRRKLVRSRRSETNQRSRRTDQRQTNLSDGSSRKICRQTAFCKNAAAKRLRRNVGKRKSGARKRRELK